MRQDRQKLIGLLKGALPSDDRLPLDTLRLAAESHHRVILMGTPDADALDEERGKAISALIVGMPSIESCLFLPV